MNVPELLLIWEGAPVASLLVWAAVLIVLLYLARRYSHNLITSLARVLSYSLRLMSRSLQMAEKNLQRRNRDVLFAAGREESERFLEREFERVNLTVRRDLGSYPALSRTLNDLTTRIDEDYRESTEVPPTVPGWDKAVASVVAIPASGDKVVGPILLTIQKTMEKQEKEALEAYRKATNERHSLLTRMVPFWRKLANTLSKVDKSITGLEERSRAIDRHMEELEEIRRGTDRAARKLTSSAMTQFVVSGLVLLIALGGAVINFNLIALPMSEMVGGGSYIGPYKTSSVAALVIILVEISMGLFLMESFRITRLFPVIGTMDDRMRRKMVVITLTILVIMAAIESALAFMRDIMVAEKIAFMQELTGAGALAVGEQSIIPTIGQMTMGFILPFALTFVAIPFESFVHSSRTVLGEFLAFLVRALAGTFRVIGVAIKYGGGALINLYDLVIFLPLRIESVFTKTRNPDAEGGGHTTNAAVALLLAVGLGATGCADTTSRATGIYMLMDTSGTYAEELEKADTIVKYLLGTLEPGDTLAVGRIDTGSFSEKDIISKVTFDSRPSVANKQKRAFSIAVEEFVGSVRGSKYTDITGGILQATEYLDEAGTGKKIILIFSDMEEDIKEGYVRDIAFDMKGYRVIALNVTKLRGDIVDPREYMDRLEKWRLRVEEGGGTWKVINDLERLEAIFKD